MSEMYDGIIATLEKNPSIRPMALAAIDKAAQELPFDELVAAISEIPTAKTRTQTPPSIVTLMVSKGALHQTIYVDGEVYNGTLEDLQADEDIAEDAEVEYTLVRTEDGLNAARQYAPSRKLRDLYAANPNEARVFTMVLQACSQEGGILRDDIEALLKQDGDALAPRAKSGIPSISPAYFTGELEEAGGITWDKTWKTTKEGEAFLTTVN